MDKILAIARKVFEIEAKSIAALSDALTEDFSKAVQAILQCKGRVVVCGMGKSGLIGKKIAATLASTGTPSFFMHPAEAFHGDLGMVIKEDIFLGISNSGETEEIIRLIPSIKRNGNQFIAMCGKSDSTLAQNADYFLNVWVAEEACPLQLAPTSSTTATLAMGDALAVALMEERGFKSENFALYHPGGNLGKKLLTHVKDVMRTENLPFVQPETNIRSLIFTMTEGKLGLAMVVENEQLIGIVTDGDLRRAWTQDEHLHNKKVIDIMTKSPKTISPDMVLVEAEQLLIENKITSVVVTDSNHKVMGILQVYTIK